MTKLIEKHLQNKRGRGKITVSKNEVTGKTMTFSPKFWGNNNIPKLKIQSKPTLSNPYLTIPRDVIANDVQLIEQNKRILEELDKNAELYKEYAKKYRKKDLKILGILD